jgi:hypothetical protein
MKTNLMKITILFALSLLILNTNLLAKSVTVKIGSKTFTCVTNNKFRYDGSQQGDNRWTYDYVGTVETDAGGGETYYYTQCLDPGTSACLVGKISGNIYNENGVLVCTADEINDYVYGCQHEMFIEAGDGEESGSSTDNIIRNQFTIYRNYSWTYNHITGVFNNEVNITFVETMEVED